MDLAAIAVDICRNVGREFPDPLTACQDMVLRQLSSLVEEAIELDAAIKSCDQAAIADELCDASLIPYMVAHYAEIDLDAVIAGTSPRYEEPPYRLAGAAMKAGRRYLGIARRAGSRDALATALAQVVLSVRWAARVEGIDLDQAVARKVDVIFNRGWREASQCAG